jgi:glycosyltransferase involved in cell wall biosynthesis
LRIALVSPLFESVPPKFYGGTERVISYLVEELVARGHEVTLFASGDSVTTASLRAATERSLRLHPECKDPLVYHVIQLDQVAEAASEFDVIHFNVDYLHYSLAQRLHLPSLTTLHGRLDLPDLVPLHRRFQDHPLVSVSDAQRAPLFWANWVATVHHGLPKDLYSFHEKPGSYVAFLGRISPEKRPDIAALIARRAGIPLKIAAKVDTIDRTYYESIRPLLEGPGVEFIGEINEREKDTFLGEALALLFPIDWPEPFGLVMIEAMACGTPVIAYRCGSVLEVVTDKVTGFVVQDERQAVAALENIAAIDRGVCRRTFEQRFTAQRMADEYLRVYGSIISGSKRKPLIVA